MQRATTTIAALFSTTTRLAAAGRTPCSLRLGSALSMSRRQPGAMSLMVNNGSSFGKDMAMAMTNGCQFRGYASKKDAKKGGSGKGGKGAKKGSNNDDDDDDVDSGSRKGKGKSSAGGSGAADAEMTFDPLDLEKKMGQCLERLKKDFTTMRAGTANPAILDPVMVKVENKMVQLRDLAQVSIKDAKTLMVNVNDEALTTSIEKAIREAGLNLNPIADNKAVRVPVPKPTKEFRESLTKLAAASAEKAKTIIRKLRQDGMKDLKKDLKAGMSEDENYTLEKKAQTLHDKYIKDIDDGLKAKTKEIMSN